MAKITKTILLFLTLIIASSGVAYELSSVCDRSPAVKDFLETELQKACHEIDTDDLASVERITVARQEIEFFLPGDFSGLNNMEILNIRSNPFTHLPEGLFAGLYSLKTLVIIGGDFEQYPEDFLLDTPNLENCHCFRNNVENISDEIIERFGALQNLKVLDFDSNLEQETQDKLREFFPTNGVVKLTFH